MIDFDLAELYGVTTSRLNEQVARNRRRFPVDFMFRLTKKEAESLRSHFAISNAGSQTAAITHPKIGTPPIQIQQDSN